jgi:hypothetical protein
MTITATIKHDAPEGAASKQLVVTVVTVGNPETNERRELLQAGQSTSVQLYPGQFVMLDEKEA